MDKKVRILYDALVDPSNGFEITNLGTFEEFESKMKDSNKRRVLYDAIKGRITNLGTFEEFENKVAPKAKQPTAEEIAKSVETYANPYGLGVKFDFSTPTTTDATTIEQDVAKATDNTVAENETPTAPKADTPINPSESVIAPKAEKPISAFQKADGTPFFTKEDVMEYKGEAPTESTPVAETKNVVEETPTQETEVVVEEVEQPQEETNEQEEVQQEGDSLSKWYKAHKNALGEAEVKYSGYTITNAPQWVEDGMMNNSYWNNYDTQVAGIVYNAIAKTMQKDGVVPSEDDVKAKISSMSSEDIDKSLSEEDKSHIAELKTRYQEADEDKGKAVGVLSEVVKDPTQREYLSKIVGTDNPEDISRILGSTIKGLDGDLRQALQGNDSAYDVTRKAIADYLNVSGLLGEKAYTDFMSKPIGSDSDAITLGKLWRNMFGTAEGAKYPKQYETLVANSMRKVYNSGVTNTEAGKEFLNNAIGRIDAYIDVKNRIDPKKMDMLLVDVNKKLPYGNKIHNWEDVIFYEHPESSPMPFALTPQAEALNALNSYINNMALKDANAGEIKAIEAIMKERAEANMAETQKKLDANPHLIANESMVNPANRASNFSTDREYLLYKSALEIREDALKYGNNASSDNGFMRNLASGLIDGAIDIDTWDFGIGEFDEAMKLKSIIDKSEQGKTLTDGENAFIDAIATRLAVETVTKPTRGYKAGMVTAESLPFMAEMIFSPIKGGGALANKFARLMLKKYGKDTIKKNAGKFILGKALSRVGGDIGKAYGVTLTTGSLNVVADAINSTEGQVAYEVKDGGKVVAKKDEEGKIVTKEAVGGAEAIVDAINSRAIENFSEFTGGYFGWNWLKPLADKVGLSKAVKYYDKISSTEWAKNADKFFEKTQWNGPIEEFNEEIVGGVLNALIVGDQTLDTAENTGVFNKDNLIDTALGVGVMSVFMSSVKTMGYRGASQQLESQKKNTIKLGEMAFGEDWEAIQSTIDNATPHTLSQELNTLLSNNELSADGKRIVMRYGMQVAEGNALISAEEKQQMAYESETKVDNASRLEGSARLGWETTDANEQYVANKQYEERGNAVVSMLQAEEKTADEALLFRYGVSDSYDIADKVSADADLDTKQKQTILGYLDSREQIKSMGERAVYDARMDALNTVRSDKSNIQSGKIIIATHKVDGHGMYVIDGNVELNEDGTINVANSDESIIVENKETGKRDFISPSMLSSITEEQAPDVVGDAINAKSQAYTNAMTYGHTLEQGENIVIDGVTHTVGNVDYNNNVVSFTDGTTITLEELAQEANQRNAERTKVEEVAKATPKVAEVAEQVQETAETPQEAEQTVPQQEYTQGKTIVYKDGNGDYRMAEVMQEADPDGNILIIDTFTGNTYQVPSSQLDQWQAEANAQRAEETTQEEKVEQPIAENSPIAVEATEDVEQVGTPTATETQAEVAPQVAIPTDEKGNLLYEQASVEDTINSIYNDPDLEEEEADAFVDNKIAKAQQGVDELAKNKPKMGDNIPQFKAEKKQWEAQIAEAQRVLDYWNGVKAQRAKAKEVAQPSAITEVESAPKVETPQAEQKQSIKSETTPGVVRNAYSAYVPQEQVEQLDKVAKALGVQIEFVSTMRGANAKIVGNKITVALDAEQIQQYEANGVTMVIGHELTHRIKSLSNETFEDFAKTIEDIFAEQITLKDGTQIPSFKQRMISTRLAYSRQGMKISNEALREEVVADLAGLVMTNGNLMDKFLTALEPKSTKQQILDAIKRMFDAIKGVFQGEFAREIAKAEKVLLKALNEASAVVNEGETIEADNAGQKLSILGVKGAEALDKAEEATIRMDNLAKARKMERFGYSANEVRRATGWERGADGKWRYEIDDVELDKSVLRKLRIDTPYSLSEIVTAETYNTIVTAYPSFKDIKVLITPLESIGGDWDNRRKIIRVSPKYLNGPKGLKNVLSHEIQHAIQDSEGFARGSHPMEFMSIFIHPVHIQQMSMIRSTADDLVKEGKYKYLRSAIRSVVNTYLDRGWIDNSVIKEYNMDGSIDSYVDNIASYTAEELMQEAHNAHTANDKYNRTAGEVESRNVQSRLDYTPEQRRATLLADTEDVAREDQIFLMSNSGVSAMGSTVVKRKADIAVKLQGKDISPTQLKVVDAFTTDANNIAIDVVDTKGKQRSITLKQGQDNKAGVKHSVLKHYETASNSYTAEEILLIPQVIEQGERRQDGKKISYKMDIDGVTYSVTTEIKGNHEEFTNFFTNKKPTIEEQGSLNTANQHEQPQQSVSTDKDSDNVGDVQEDAKYSLRSNPQEVADIVAKAKADGTYMKAPNGEATNLTEEQWANVRTKAFKDWFGDWEKDPKNASKVVDENGEPMVVYHGSAIGGFSVFGKAPKGIYFADSRQAVEDYTFDNNAEVDNFFPFNPMAENQLEIVNNWLSNKEGGIISKGSYIKEEDGKWQLYAPSGNKVNGWQYDPDVMMSLLMEWEASRNPDFKGKGIYPTFLNIKKPFVFDAEGGDWASLPKTINGVAIPSKYMVVHQKSTVSTDEWAEFLQSEEGVALGFDGMVVKDVYDSLTADGTITDYIAFSPNQIKSATENEGTYSNESDDIRYSLRGTTDVQSVEDVMGEMMERNPKGWESIKDKLRGTSVWNEVVNDEEFVDVRDDEDVITGEVLSRLEVNIDDLAEQMVNNAKGVFEKADAVAMADRMRRALKEFDSWAEEEGIKMEDTESLAETTEGEDVKYSLRGDVAEKEVKNVILNDTEGMPLPNDRKSAFEYIPEGGIVYKNDAEGVDIKVSRKSVKHTALHKNNDTFAIFGGIGEIIKEAIKIGEIPVAQDEIGKTNSVGIFYVPVNINGTQYSARLLVKELINNDIVLDDLSLYHVGLHKEKGSQYKPLNASNEVGGVTAKPKSKYKVKELIHNSQEQDKKILGITEDTKFSLRSILHPKDGGDIDGTRAEYNRRVGVQPGMRKLGYKFREGHQDSMLSLKILQKIVAKKNGKKVKDIPTWQNAYIEENLMSSRNKAEKDIYMRDFFVPLMEVVEQLRKKGLKYEEITRYMIAKHGLERNAYMAEQVARGEADKKSKDKESKEWQNVYNDSLDKAQYRDYSGLTALFDVNTVQEAESLAQALVDTIESKYKGEVTKLWDKVRKATQESLATQYKAGLISRQTYNKVRDMYQYYIPLKGFEAKTVADEYAYLADNAPLLPSLDKRAMGRSSLADDPLATIAMDADTAIIKANRNKMKQAFYHFVKNNPSSLVSVSEQWYVKDGVSGKWVASLPEIGENATGEEIQNAIEEHEKRMKELEKEGIASTKTQGLELDYIALPQHQVEHAVRVKINGKEYVMYINGNPRAAQALNGLTNIEAYNWEVLKYGKKINNFMAQMFTSSNPAFIFTNGARDIQWATNAVMIKENLAYQTEYAKSLAKATQIPRLIIKSNKGTLNMDKETQKYFDEFLRYGGETGYTAIQNINDYKEKVDRLVNGLKAHELPAEGARQIFEGIEYLNRSVEDITRFAVYMTSRKMGRSPERSAYDAKEITVNFNKKGSGIMGARYMGTFYLFYNASVQSLNNLAKIYKHNPIKASARTAIWAGVASALPMLNTLLIEAWGDDDDKEAYDNLPEWVLKNNLVFYIPGTEKKFLTISLPHEVRPWTTMGYVANQVLSDKMDTGEAFKQITLGFADMLPMDFAGNGGNVGVNLTPTWAQPFTQLIANVDYFGKPIYKESDYNKLDPEFTTAFKGTSPILVDVSRKVNEMSGGDDSQKGWFEKKFPFGSVLNNPDAMQHLIESYFGGVGKFVNKSINTFAMIENEDMREVKNLPIISSFMLGAEERTSTGYKATQRYYEIKNIVDEFKNTEKNRKKIILNGLKNDATEEEKAKYKEYFEKLKDDSESEKAKQVLFAEGYISYINKLRQGIEEVSPSRINKIEEAIKEAMTEMNNGFEDAKNKSFEDLMGLEKELPLKAKAILLDWDGKNSNDVDYIENQAKKKVLNKALNYNKPNAFQEFLKSNGIVKDK